MHMSQTSCSLVVLQGVPICVAESLSCTRVLLKPLQNSESCVLDVWYRGKANIERPVLSFWEDANRMQAEEEEVHLVREFEERLKYNLQQVLHLQARTLHWPRGFHSDICLIQLHAYLLACSISSAAVKVQAMSSCTAVVS